MPIIVIPPVQAIAMSQEQQNLFTEGIDFFDTQASCTPSDTTALTGSDNDQKTWNFFKSKGLDDTHTAAVMGNIMQEATPSIDPEIVQNGGDSQDPSAAGDLGWGIVQWTPGEKVVGIAQSLNISGPIYELGTQLSIVWAEMGGTSPTGDSNMLTPFNQTTSISDAVEYFRAHFEGGSPGDRLTFANQALSTYGGQPGDTSTTSSSASDSTQSACGGGVASSVSPDCTSVTGDARILCDAKRYDPVSYVWGGGHSGGAKWHTSCPTIGPSCGLDCSGLVNIAVYDVFGVDLDEDTNTERADEGKYWQEIPLSQVQPGDLIQPYTGHVEIIDHVVGNHIYTFGAHTDKYPQPKQVGAAGFTVGPGQIYLHYIGPGSS